MALVTVEPGARTAWHTHPLAQTLIVIAGCGRAQCGGGPIEETRPGGVVWFPPVEKYRHGAGQVTAVRQVATQEKLNGSPVDWTEQAIGAQPQAQPTTHAGMQQFGYSDDAVSVSFEEILPADWTGKACEPGILNGASTLYKKPGYGPS